MEGFKMKLRVSQGVSSDLYVINNIKKGFVMALNNENIKENKEVFSQLQRLQGELDKIPLPVNRSDIRRFHQMNAIRIADKALRVINDHF